MPDQSSAATEHAILQEITAPLADLPDDAVAMVQPDFPGALRGYDRIAVDAYVQQVSQLVAELQATRSPEAAVRRALERVGEQISGILQRAHETAEQITAQSRVEAEDRMVQARAEAAEIVAAAEQRVKDLDADTDRIWIERHRIIEDARELSAQLLGVVEEAGQRFQEPTAEVEPPGQAAPAEPSEQETQVVAEAETEVFLEDAYDADSEEPAQDTGKPADDDVEATRRFEPLTDGAASETDAEAAPDPDQAGEPQVRGTRASIPPASQAAHRRASR